jgi:hypothetical protein
MKPKPLALLKNLTVPLVMCRTPDRASPRARVREASNYRLGRKTTGGRRDLLPTRIEFDEAVYAAFVFGYQLDVPVARIFPLKASGVPQNGAH